MVVACLVVAFIVASGFLVHFRKTAHEEKARRLELEQGIRAFLACLSAEASKTLSPLAEGKGLTVQVRSAEANDPTDFLPGMTIQIIDPIHPRNNEGLVVALGFNWWPGASQQRVNLRVSWGGGVAADHFPLEHFGAFIEEARAHIIHYADSLASDRGTSLEIAAS
jgi:hypothetical protein